MHSGATTLIGSGGVALLLLAFLLHLLRLLRVDGAVYAGLNFVGASLACSASYLIDFKPFVVLEGAWAVVAAVALMRAVSVGPPGTPDGAKS